MTGSTTTFEPMPSLSARAPHASDPVDPAFVPADEQEPWWAVLGQPLTRAEALAAASGEPAALGLQLRPESERPKRIRLLAWGGVLHLGSWA